MRYINSHFTLHFTLQILVRFNAHWTSFVHRVVSCRGRPNKVLASSAVYAFYRVFTQRYYVKSLPPSSGLHDNNNNLRSIMVKINCSTLHTVCNIQQSATRGSNDTTHRLSRRTAEITRFSPKGIGCQKQTAPSFRQHPIRRTLTSQAFTRWRHLSIHPINRAATHLSTPEGWKAELA